MPELIPIVRHIQADFDTPISVYWKLAQTNLPSFLLESVVGGEKIARYSFIGVQPRAAYLIRGQQITIHSGTALDQIETLTVAGNPLHHLRKVLTDYSVQPVPGLPPLVGGLVGYLGYESVRFFEPTLQLPLGTLPDGIFLLVDTLVAFDHVGGKVLAIAYSHGATESAMNDANARLQSIATQLAQPLPPIPSQPANTPQHTQSHTLESFSAMVLAAQEHIRAGDIFQVVLSQRVTRTCQQHPFQVYRQLRMLNPAPYLFFYDFGRLVGEQFYLLGASPETHVRVEAGKAILRPIAGTRPRGQTVATDEALAIELLADPKELAEHIMLVDLGRNDLGRVCTYGSVKVTELMVIERYSHVMHIVSQIEGQLRPDVDGFDALAATFPAGTVSGAPKVRAMEIIAAQEKSPRGPYAGIVGYFSFDGNMDTCIALRTLYQVGDKMFVQAGAGVVLDSQPASEYQETINKALAGAKAIDLAEQMAGGVR